MLVLSHHASGHGAACGLTPRSSGDPARRGASARTLGLMKTLIAFAVLLHFGYAAAHEAAPLVVPPATRLTVLEHNPEQIMAKFGGQIEVSGFLVAQWVFYQDIDQKMYVLVLDSQSVATIPHFQGNPILHLEVNNGPMTLDKATGPGLRRDFEAKRVRYLKVPGTFLLEHLEVGVECGAAWSRANILAVKPQTHAIARNGEKQLPMHC